MKDTWIRSEGETGQEGAVALSLATGAKTKTINLMAKRIIFINFLDIQQYHNTEIKMNIRH